MIDFLEYAALDATGLSALIRRREVCSAEVTESAYAALRALNPRLNAVAGELFDPPLIGEAQGALSGVPTVLKDIESSLAGLPITAGSRLLDGFVCEESSPFVERMLASGMVILGRSTTPEFGFIYSTESEMYGATRNPWDLQRTVGGSSGGSAALVAARVVPLADGSDAGGSIRVPASYCGLVGLKPSHGRMALKPRYATDIGAFATNFPLVRSVRDMALCLDLLAGAHPGDVHQLPPPQSSFVDQLNRDVGPLRIAATNELWTGVRADRDMSDALDRTLNLLEELGHQVTHVAPEVPWERLDDAWRVIDLSQFAYGVRAAASAMSRSVEETVEPATRLFYEAGLSYNLHDLYPALEVLAESRWAFGEFFDAFNVLVTPTTPSAAFELGVLAPSTAQGKTADELAAEWKQYGGFTAPFNMSGHPALSLPLETTPAGLSLGLQFVAHQGREDILVQLAAQLESARPWRDRRPDLVGRGAGDGDDPA